jgi:serine/threonine-protein kinase
MSSKRLQLFSAIGAGALGTVHLGKIAAAGGFSRIVAVKRMREPSFGDDDRARMAVDEARLAARVHHPNVVAVVDVIVEAGEILLVMEYVHGASLSSLLQAASEGAPVPAKVAAAIVADVLLGLHAAHEATNERGEPLGLVHRDVSPSNVVVGADGIARIMDFGVAKAAGRLHHTRTGEIRGKLSYMPPEQLHGEEIDRRVDVYAAGVLLWEILARRPLFSDATDEATIDRILHGSVPPPSEVDERLAPFDDVVLRATDRERDNRFETAHDMASLIERTVGRASPSEVGAWLERVAGPTLAERARTVERIEAKSTWGGTPRPRSRKLAVVGGAVLTLALVAVGARPRASAPPEPGPAGPASSAATTPAASEPAVGTSSAPTAQASGAFSSPLRGRMLAPPRGQSSAPSPRIDCSMPFKIDADGHKHFRPECAR